VTTSYIQFHLAFVVPALLAVVVATWLRDRSAWRRTLGLGTPIVIVLAVAYTTPWDNYLVARRVWWYGDQTVLARIWWAPIEEYAFFVFQSLLTALWLGNLDLTDVTDVSVSRPARVGGVVVAVALGALGVVAILAGPKLLYLGAIVAWAAPVFAVQWAFGWPVLARARRTVLAGVLVPTLYLCVADRIAIEAGIWILSPTYTNGVAVLGLPIEEALFFLVTNLFVVQGLVLLRWALAAPSVAVPAVVRRYLPTVEELGAVVPR